MPVVTGIECLKQIMSSCPDAKVVMVTSVGKENLIAEAMELGAKAVINKPIDESTVMPIIDTLL